MQVIYVYYSEAELEKRYSIPMIPVLWLSLLVRLSAGVYEDTLEIVHIIFRHGEKNPDVGVTYPNDPYRNATFQTFSQAQLNKVGRRTMYDLGHTLRERYDNYLGKTYSEDSIEAWASSYSRTKLSLQLVMASLFAPSEEERWHKKVDWQPTNFHSLNLHEDKLFLGIKQSEYNKEYNKVCASKQVQSLIRKYRDCIKYLEEHSGYTSQCLRGAYMLYIILNVEESANWTLPNWTHSVYPEPLKELSLLEYKIQIYTNKLKRLLMGNLFVKILSDTENRINLNSPLKFHLYSAHEGNVYHALNLLGFTSTGHPGYGACIIIEVHRIDHHHVLKVFYRSNKNEDFKLMDNHQGKNYIAYEEFKNLIFRHGEKNPDTKFAYPKDPHKNGHKTFPEGQLNKIGKRTMYDLGGVLRKRYDNCLSKIYSENEVEAWASPFGRAILSLQLVMASMFAPREQEKWHEELDWQPTIFRSEQWQDDRLFSSFMQPEYLQEYRKVCASDKIQAMMKSYGNLVPYLEKHTGFDIYCTRQIYVLYLLLESEREANLTLPDWTHRVYPEPLKEFPLLEYKVQAYTPQLRWLLIGNLFVKILSDTENRINSNSTKKFHLYSGHELNVYQTLNLLGFATMKPHIPGYGACVIIEVHKINNRNILQVFYRGTKYDDFKLLKNQQGEDNITYDEFKHIKAWNLKLPEWTNTIFPTELTEYSLQTGSKQLKKILLGKLTAKILQQTKAKMNKTSECKIHLYSGHDNNIAHVLIFFGVMFPHFPQYGAYLIIEVHRISHKYGIKLSYKESKAAVLRYLNFENGSDFISMDQFEKMVHNLI
ncbi:hypothetical protein Trydic_g1573 [Trypoxylus dichotomus]